MRNTEFHDFVVMDLLGDVSGITSRAMFGGWGVYKYGVFFGLIADGTLYFKGDETTQKEYESLGSEPFRYSRKDAKKITMSYWLVPESVMEDRELLNEWVDRSVMIAKRNKNK